MFTIVLPAYNEAKRLETCVEAVRKELAGMDYEIIIAEDGSTDGTDKIAMSLAKKYKNIRHLHYDNKLGKGRALRNAFRISRGSEVGTMDIDMAVDVKYLKPLFNYAKDYDIVTGSRYVKGARVRRPLARELVSRSYNIIARIFLGSGIDDLQCGFKAFSRKFIEKEVYSIKENTWAWDTIVLITGARKGYKIKEFPVEWKENKESGHSSSPKRILSDIKIHGRVIAKLFAKYRLGMDVKL